MNVRRRGGEILVQKIITDRRVGFPIQTITPGDEIEVVSESIKVVAMLLMNFLDRI